MRSYENFFERFTKDTNIIVCGYYYFIIIISQIVTSYMTEYSLNLSILLSEGKETNRDFISSGERT
jgi:hypothetical protein